MHMPPVLNYPGVYVEEIPGGVRTIVGGSTSDTAFVDFFTRGPLNTPVRLTSFGDFVRRFGGLDRRSEASYAIQQYYLNGGTIAWVVRVDPGEGTNLEMKAARLILDGGSPVQQTMMIRAVHPGVWGNNLRVTIEIVDQTKQIFNLLVEEVDPRSNDRVNLQIFRDLYIDKTHSRYFMSLINDDPRSLIAVEDPGIGDMPEVVVRKHLEGGSDGSVFVSTGALAADATTAAFADALIGDERKKTGMQGLQNFNILCLPVTAKLSVVDMGRVITAALDFAPKRRAFFIIDSREEHERDSIKTVTASMKHDHAAIYYPRLIISDPQNSSLPRNVGASGTVAGIYARTDAERGFWKAPAGTDASLRGIVKITDELNDLENGELNPLGINVLRNFPIYGNIAWGARTLKGSDQEASEWKYVPVRRTALYIERTLHESLKWVVFEPNDEPLWAQIRLSIGGFMHTLFRQGAFQGSTPRQAYLVKCDSETTTQTDINMGVVNILVGFAPLKPAEFVVVKIQQLAGQIGV
jgi:uncharacterized protein